MVKDTNGFEVTDQRWSAVDLAISTFIEMHPTVWLDFKRSIAAERTEYQLATDGDLKRASWRHSLSFPVSWHYSTPEEVAADPTHATVSFDDSLKHWIEKIIPGFTEPDEGGGKGLEAQRDIKPNKLYRQFHKRYGHLFRPGEKS